MKLLKIKRPAGTFTYHGRLVKEDDLGVWLYLPRGSHWDAPHDAGTLPIDALVLLSPDRNWVAWWVDDPLDRYIGIDICLSPERSDDGWTFVDLELDPKRHENGTVEIEDRDEFDAACRDGWISPQDAKIAETTAIVMEAALSQAQEPFGDEGWRRLRAVQDSR